MSAQIRFGPYVVDRELFQLRKDDRVVHLEPRSSDVLVYLIENRVVSTDEIIREVWRRAVSKPSVGIVIVELCRALRDDAKRATYLVTHRCRGYRFAHPVAEQP